MNTFTCASCKETFERDPEWSTADAKAEYEQAFGLPIESVEDVGVVCDDCYVKIVAWAKAKGLVL